MRRANQHENNQDETNAIQAPQAAAAARTTRNRWQHDACTDQSICSRVGQVNGEKVTINFNPLKRQWRFFQKKFPWPHQWREKISSFQSIPLPPVGGGATLQTRKNSPPIRKATPHELFGSVLKCSASMIKPESRECGGEIFHGWSGNRVSSEFPQSISNKRFAP